MYVWRSYVEKSLRVRMSEPLLEVWHEGKTYAMTPQTLLTELTYSNYRYNRRLSPEITPEQWRKVIPEFTPEMETRFQAEQAKG